MSLRYPQDTCGATLFGGTCPPPRRSSLSFFDRHEGGGCAPAPLWAALVGVAGCSCGRGRPGQGTERGARLPELETAPGSRCIVARCVERREGEQSQGGEGGGREEIYRPPRAKPKSSHDASACSAILSHNGGRKVDSVAPSESSGAREDACQRPVPTSVKGESRLLGEVAVLACSDDGERADGSFACTNWAFGKVYLP